eukprot:scaffold258284_cov30-Tisochrysis_lutea.AAC.2
MTVCVGHSPTCWQRAAWTRETIGESTGSHTNALLHRVAGSGEWRPSQLSGRRIAPAVVLSALTYI